MNKRLLFSLMAVTAFAFAGCDDDKSSSNEPETCEGENCEKQCEGENCEKQCEGENCEKQCEGENCEKQCEGENCEKQCEGENCEKQCEGENCEKQCEGDSCGIDPGLKTYPDADGDTISDKNEGYKDDPAQCTDTDGDTVPDYLDLDSDDDTIPDSVEAMNGGNPANPAKRCSGSLIPAFRTNDADGNGILDADEIQLDENGKPLDTDNDTVPDYCDDDNDGDGMIDFDEYYGYFNKNKNEYAMDCNGDTVADEPGQLGKPFDCDGDTVPDYMSTDSDGDTIPDKIERNTDSDADGFLDRYSKDSDGDTVPDSLERGNGEEPLDTDGDGLYDYQDRDSDNDGLLDEIEKTLVCDDGSDPRINGDVDGDDQSDLVEYTIALAKDLEPKSLMCNKGDNVKNHGVTFYFELPSSGEERTDTLPFEPLVNKADIVILTAHNGLMESEINILKQSFVNDVAKNVLERVNDVAFGVATFSNASNMDSKDAFKVIQSIKKIGRHDDGSVIEADLKAFNENLATINAVANSTDHDNDNGGKGSISGYNALKKIATDSGVGFREQAMRVVIYVSKDIMNEDGATASQATEALVNKGIRVIPVNSNKLGNDKNAYIMPQNSALAADTKSVVPYCAYSFTDTQSGEKTTAWECGENLCCTNDFFSQNNGRWQNGVVGVAPTDNQCVLALNSGSITVKSQYTTSDYSQYNGLAYEIMLAIEALVKYGTYDIGARVVGEPLPPNEIAGTKTDTSCFIQKIEALNYKAPADQATAACLEVSVKTDVTTSDSSLGYNDKFVNFAVGTADPNGDKATLEFKVTAKNDNCVVTSTVSRSYNATIEVFNPGTGMVFATHEVAIIVPGTAEEVEVIN